MMGVAPPEHLCYAVHDMDLLEKLAHSAEATAYESAEGIPSVTTCFPQRSQTFGYTTAELRHRFGVSDSTPHVNVDGRRIPIHMAVVPGGRRIPLLKAMLSTACTRDCLYCAFRSGRDFRRITFSPEEMANSFHSIHRAGKVDGLFLSSGVFNGGANCQNKLLDTCEILRRKLGYRAYLHLKIMPGAEHGQVLRAMRLADRVSVNLEAPNQERLSCLAPTKRFVDELLCILQWIDDIRQNLPPAQGWKGRWPSSTTQFVVGAAGESDLEILGTVAKINHAFGLGRAYFEAFNPVEGTPLENHPGEDPLRQHRLYQASFLLRDYGFDLEDLPFSRDGSLPLDRDPKLAYAQETLATAPIEINQADRDELLRVPGIGRQGATVILRERRLKKLRGLSDLRKLGVMAERAAPYITMDGRRPPQQLPLI
jgi:predicted DNA-binding helix-hairpin-helix protein